MNRCKMLLLTLAAIVGLGLTAGCDQGAKKETKDEKASAKAATKTDGGAEEKADPNAPPLEATGPVAIVDGEEIPAEEFNKAVERRAGAMGGRMPPRLAQMMKTRTVERLINERIIDKKLASANVEVAQEEVEAEFKKFKERFPNEQAFQSFLTRSGMTAETMKENIGKDLQLRKLLSETHDIEVSEEDAKAFYEKNVQRFKQPEQVKASHVLIKTDKGADKAAIEKAKKRAQAIAKEAKKPGTDFAELAKKKSEGPSASRGGDLGYFTRQRMVPEFAEAAFNMKKGEISEPVKSQFGFHVIKVEGRKEAGTVPYEEAQERIVAQLKRQKFRKAMEEFLAKLKKDVKIEKKEDNIKVNVKAPAGGQGGPHTMGGGMNKMKLQKMLQQKMKQRQQQQQQNQQGGESGKEDPTELKLQKPGMIDK